MSGPHLRQNTNASHQIASAQWPAGLTLADYQAADDLACSHIESSIAPHP